MISDAKHVFENLGKTTSDFMNTGCGSDNRMAMTQMESDINQTWMIHLVTYISSS